MLYRRFNIVSSQDEFLDDIEVDQLGEGLELIAALGQYTKPVQDWIFPKVKKDPGYLDRVIKAKEKAALDGRPKTGDTLL